MLPPPPATVADLGCGTGTLSVLLAEEGFAVDGVDFSPRMIAQAEAKAAGHDRVRFMLGDAAAPPLQPGRYDVVLSRHVLWAMPDPAAALVRWCGLLRPTGSLVLVEGSWSTGAGLGAEETAALVRETGRSVEVRRLADEPLWGRPVADERYLVTSPPA